MLMNSIVTQHKYDTIFIQRQKNIYSQHTLHSGTQKRRGISQHEYRTVPATEATMRLHYTHACTWGEREIEREKCVYTYTDANIHLLACLSFRATVGSMQRNGFACYSDQRMLVVLNILFISIACYLRLCSVRVCFSLSFLLCQRSLLVR